MTSRFESLAWRDFPMGPSIRKYLGIEDEDYRGAEGAVIEPQKRDDFRQFILGFIAANPVDSKSALVSIMEELVAMEYGDVCLKVYRSNTFPNMALDYRVMLSLGSASMLERDLDDAEKYMSQARKLAPREIAPLANLAGIYYHQKRDDEALNMALCGLAIDRNYRRLWELVGLLFQTEDQQTAGMRVRDLSRKLGSWTGASLGARLIDPNDHQLRAELLEEVYNHGERQQDFLIELTAAYGLVGQFEKIPQIVWQAQMGDRNNLRWELLVHGGQAQLALNQIAEAMELLDLALQAPALPDVARNQIESMVAEARSQMH